MDVKWFIEDFDEGNRYHVLADEVKKQGMDCELYMCNVKPIVEHATRIALNQYKEMYEC